MISKITNFPGLQTGVKAMIVISFVIAALVVIYAVLYKVGEGGKK